MSDLNDRLKDRKNYHNSEEGLMSPNSIDDIEYPDAHVKMEGKKVGKIVGKFIPEDMDGLALQSPTPEQIDHDILENLKTLRERVTMLEKTCADLLAYIENHVKQLSYLEGRIQGLEQAVRMIELKGLRGNG